MSDLTHRKIRLQDEFRRRLAKLAEERNQRLDWMAYEEAEMLSLVNAFRSTAGLPDVDPQVVARANVSASGHIDYAWKFSLYCAEIVLGVSSFQGSTGGRI